MIPVRRTSLQNGETVQRANYAITVVLCFVDMSENGRNTPRKMAYLVFAQYLHFEVSLNLVIVLIEVLPNFQPFLSEPSGPANGTYISCTNGEGITP